MKRLPALGVLLFALGPLACAALTKVTKDERARGYTGEAAAVHELCKAYRFDRATGLVDDVPSMTTLCETE